MADPVKEFFEESRQAVVSIKNSQVKDILRYGEEGYHCWGIRPRISITSDSIVIDFLFNVGLSSKVISFMVDIPLSEKEKSMLNEPKPEEVVEQIPADNPDKQTS